MLSNSSRNGVQILAFIGALVVAIFVIDVVWNGFLLIRLLRWGYVYYITTYLLIFLVMFVKFPPTTLVGVGVRGIVGGYVASVVGYFISDLIGRAGVVGQLMATPVEYLEMIFVNMVHYVGVPFGLYFALAFWLIRRLIQMRNAD